MFTEYEMTVASDTNAISSAAENANKKMFKLKDAFGAYRALAGLLVDPVHVNGAGFKNLDRGDLQQLVSAVNKTVEKLAEGAHDAVGDVTFLCDLQQRREAVQASVAEAAKPAHAANVFHGDVGTFNQVAQGAMNNHGKPKKKGK